MQPEAFDRIEEGTIAGQPHHMQALLKQAQSCYARSAAMIRSVVHNDDHLHIGIGFQHEILDELDEAVTVFAILGLMPDGAIAPVVRAEGMGVTRRPRCGNGFALPAFHPAAAQDRMQAYACFVHKEEDEGKLGEGLFFNQSRKSSAAALASASCKSLRSCFGWR